MRKLLYILYTILASYPVIFLLVLATVGVIYLGTGYRPVEAHYEALLAERVQLKQDRQRLAEELEGMRQGDLLKRIQIFSNEFLAADEVEEARLTGVLNTALAASGWSIESAAIKMEEMPEEVLGLGALVVAYEGRAQGLVLSDDSSFLPTHSLMQACTYLWRKSPIKDFSRICIERDSKGYRVDLDVVYLMRALTESEEVEE